MTALPDSVRPAPNGALGPRKICDGVHWVGAVHWERRLFDSLIPLPDGTSYNAYLVTGQAKTALIDTVDPELESLLLAQLEGLDRLDYVVSLHAEQDHSGGIPAVLARFPGARVVTSPMAKGMLQDLLGLPEEVFVTVKEGETLELGGKTLEFISTPWVHWPETMSAFLREDRIVFSCDFFGSHIAATELFVADETRVLTAAKRYFAEIMMPFRNIIRKNLEKIVPYQPACIAPSHGQVYPRPELIIDAYRDWVDGPPKNIALIPYVSMHGSTKLMVDFLASRLAARGVVVELFDLSVTDIGQLAMAMVDAATIVLGTPTVLLGPHPNVAYAAVLANLLRCKARFLAVIGSYGWRTKAVEALAAAVPNLKAEVLEPVLAKGVPGADEYEALDRLAADIAERHAQNGIA